MKFFITLLAVVTMITGFTSDEPKYKLFEKSGNDTNYEKIINEIKDADIVFFGEQHNEAACHLLEQNITKSLFEIKKEKLIMAAEMFETDNQLIMDEYLSGKIGEKQFEDEMRLWPNYKTDYKPLVAFAKENKIHLVASNTPRRYASAVFEKGFGVLETFSKEAKKYMVPLPVKFDSTLNCYKSIMASIGESAKGKMKHGKMFIAEAQALKDATMAYFIYKNWKKKSLLIHFNGSYHSDNFESILWYLKKLNKNLKIKTISSVSQEDISKLTDENKNIADFIICIPEIPEKKEE